MRTPSEYLPTALAKLRNQLLRDCTVTLCHGEYSASVTRVGSTTRGEDAISNLEVSEFTTVLALAADFPTLTRGSFVQLDNDWHLVVRAKTDPAHVSLVVGLSAAFNQKRIAYKRPGTRSLQGIDVLAVEGECLEPNQDAFAPTSCHQWTLAIVADEWDEPTAPQVGDAIELDDVNMRVATVVQRDGFWIITARARR